MARTIVVKVGTSSITDGEGVIDRALVAKLCDEVAVLRSDGARVVVVTSGAIAAGLPALGMGGERRPSDSVTLQAVSAVGQGNLIGTYQEALGRHGLVAGQVLLAPLDFFVRAQYLHARGTLTRLLELGVVPVVNENDAIADDEIRFGDNDRIGFNSNVNPNALSFCLSTSLLNIHSLSVSRKSSNKNWIKLFA